MLFCWFVYGFIMGIVFKYCYRRWYKQTIIVLVLACGILLLFGLFTPTNLSIAYSGGNTNPILNYIVCVIGGLISSIIFKQIGEEHKSIPEK